MKKIFLLTVACISTLQAKQVTEKPTENCINRETTHARRYAFKGNEPVENRGYEQRKVCQLQQKPASIWQTSSAPKSTTSENKTNGTKKLFSK